MKAVRILMMRMMIKELGRAVLFCAPLHVFPHEQYVNNGNKHEI